MTEAIPIRIGQDPAAPFIAIGDDSSFRETTVFAFVVLRRNKVLRTERRIAGIKKAFGIVPAVPLHCRVLFNEAARQKHGIAHVNDAAARAIVGRMITLINEFEMILRYAYYRFPTDGPYSEDTESDIRLLHNDQMSWQMHPVKITRKGIQGLLKHICFAIPADGSKGPTAYECEIITAEDRTKTRFMGAKKFRADKGMPWTSELGAPPGYTFQVEPRVVSAAEYPLVQIADVAAYVCSHALVQKPISFFVEQLSRIHYSTNSEFDPMWAGKN